MHFMGVGVGIQPIICGVQGLAHADTDAAAEVQVIGVKDQPDGYYRLAAAGSQYADTAFSSADLAVGVAVPSGKMVRCRRFSSRLVASESMS